MPTERQKPTTLETAKAKKPPVIPVEKLKAKEKITEKSRAAIPEIKVKKGNYRNIPKPNCGYKEVVAERVFPKVELADKFTDIGRAQRALRFKNVTSAVEERYKIPSGILLGMIMQESMGDPTLPNLSGDGGLGLIHMQPLMATRYGLNLITPSTALIDREQGREIVKAKCNAKGGLKDLVGCDDRFHPIINVDAAARMLCDSFSGSGWWGTLRRYAGRKEYPLQIMRYRAMLKDDSFINKVEKDFNDRNPSIKFSDYLSGSRQNMLTVSGGHNELFIWKNHGEYRFLGATLDDAAGEAFDKVARLLGLPYPGGPEIQKAALKGDPKRYPLPRAWLPGQPWNFSFSGLKTAVLRLVKEHKMTPVFASDVAASFQDAVCDVLAKKVVNAAKKFKVKEIHLAGGVSANKKLREYVHNLCHGEQCQAEPRRSPVEFMPFLRFCQKISLCTDNAAMIAAAGHFKFKKNSSKFKKWRPIIADPNLEITEW